MKASYAMLSQEPWCLTPAEWAKLTDWQIAELYRKPAEERAREFAAKHNTLPGANGLPAGALGRRPDRSTPAPPAKLSADPRSSDYRGPDGEPGSDTHKAQIVGAFRSMMGLTQEKAEAMYAEQLAQWKATRGDGNRG